MKYFIYTIIGIVAAAVVAGFFIVGSPKEERLRKLDDLRVQDLQFLQSEILTYWINKEHLPENLDLLKDDIRGIVVPKDRETGEDYSYAVKGPETFELCATFARPNLPKTRLDGNTAKPARAPEPFAPVYDLYSPQNWQHDAGLVCFERTIDKEIYKPVKRQ